MSLKMFASGKLSTGLGSIKNILGVAAGKGGVGKSTLTVNLARALKKLGFSVGVLDADIYGPSIRKMLPEEHLPLSENQQLFPATSAGIKVLSLAFFREEKEAAAVRSPIANSVITQFLHEVSWGELDFLLIDFPPGTGDIQLTLCQQAHLTGTIVVTTPQEVALLDVRKAMSLFTKLKVPIIGVIENMSYYQPSCSERVYPFGQGGGKKLAQEANALLLGEIPLDQALCASGDAGNSLFEESISLGSTADLILQAAAKIVECLHTKAKTQKNTLNQLAEETNLKPNDPHFSEIKKIYQKDEFSFLVEWYSGTTKTYQLSALQRECPCARCVDEVTNERLKALVNEKVRAHNIRRLGNYALKIDFDSGCSAGIYDYEFLYQRGIEP